MSDVSKSIYASKPFKFIVEGDTVYVHADLLSCHSKPFDRMINGGMSESQSGYATLKEVERNTFVRFAEWMYRGYYTPGDFKRSPIDDSSVEETEGEKEEEVKEVNVVKEMEEGEEDIKPAFGSLPVFKYQTFDAASLISESQTPLRAELKRLFICRKARVRQESISISRPRPNLAPDEDYTDVFLSHAQLYFFAEKYDIQVLRMLALETLQNVLPIFTLHKERTGDIITLSFS